jgi:hypothetical protein
MVATPDETESFERCLQSKNAFRTIWFAVFQRVIIVLTNVRVTCSYVTCSTHVYVFERVKTLKSEHVRLRHMTRRVRRVRVYTCLTCVTFIAYINSIKFK